MAVVVLDWASIRRQEEVVACDMRLVRGYERSHATAGFLGVALGTVNSSRRDLPGGGDRAERHWMPEWRASSGGRGRMLDGGGRDAERPAVAGAGNVLLPERRAVLPTSQAMRWGVSSGACEVCAERD